MATSSELPVGTNTKKKLLLIVETEDDDGIIEALDLTDPSSYNSTDNVVVMAHCHTEINKTTNLFNHRIEGFVEQDIPKYNDPTFKAHFRMSRSTFQSLLDKICPDLKTRIVEPSKKMLSILWLLSTEESYRSVADRFGLSKGSLHFYMKTIVDVFSSKIAEFVIWPSNEEMRKLAADVQEFPGCFGYVDGTHIAIKGRSENRDSYINRMGYSSVLLQAVADKNMRFIHVYAGWPGSIHDARVFRNSDLLDLISSVPADLHILGDSAYPLSSALMTPYRDNGKLTSVQKRYNTIHGATRSIVERSFALLKGKFRRLRHLDMSLDNSIPSVIITCVALHNFILGEEKEVPTIQCIQPVTVVNYTNATTKRDSIASAL